jgi:hypothetical protein
MLHNQSNEFSARCNENKRLFAAEKALRIRLKSAQPNSISAKRLAKKITGIQLERRQHSDLCPCSRQESFEFQRPQEPIKRDPQGWSVSDVLRYASPVHTAMTKLRPILEGWKASSR